MANAEKPVDHVLELERAYRALGALYRKVVNGEDVDQTMLTYHSPAIAAALRYMDTGELSGSEFFIGQHYSVLAETLNSAKK